MVSNAVIVVSPWGRLEGPRALPFCREMALLASVSGADVRVELSNVPIMNETVAQAIADAAARLRRSGGRLRLGAVRSQPRQLLTGLGLEPTTEPAAPRGLALVS